MAGRLLWGHVGSVRGMAYTWLALPFLPLDGLNICWGCLSQNGSLAHVTVGDFHCFQRSLRVPLSSFNGRQPVSPLQRGSLKIEMLIQWATCQICKLAGCACAGYAGFPRHWHQRKPLVSDPGMYHGTCVTHVPWCMSGSLTRVGGENVAGIPSTCATGIFTYLAKGPC